MPAKRGHPVRRAACDLSRAQRNTGSSAGACHRAAIRPTRWRMMTNEVGRSPSSSLLQIFPPSRADVPPQIGARHAEGDIGAEEAGLGAAIVPLALEFDAIEALGFLKPDHRIGELDLTAGAVLQRFEDLEN